MIVTIAAAALAAQLGSALPGEKGLMHPVQYCGNGYDVDVYGRCFPNGVIPPEYQAAPDMDDTVDMADPFRAAMAPIWIPETGNAIRTGQCRDDFRTGRTTIGANISDDGRQYPSAGITACARPQGGYGLPTLWR
jgi:hypothetical protein